MPNAATLAASTLLAVLAAGSALAGGLDAFRSKARPVVVFAPKANDPAATDQIRRLRAERAALADREMPVFVVAQGSVRTLAGGHAPATLKADELRRTFAVGEGDFALVLVGKDGDEKFRTAEPVEAGRLIGLVDQMPMRKNETR